MSDFIKHECGIAYLRLLKPIEYYQKNYQSSLYGLKKIFLIIQKQYNRGQDGVGLANLKLEASPGQEYMYLKKSVKPDAIKDVFDSIYEEVLEPLNKNSQYKADVGWQKRNLPFLGELFLGHLRYGTYGTNSLNACHPFSRYSNWRSKNLILAGNFNLTNVNDLLDNLVSLGQHPRVNRDTVTILEKVGHFLDEENSRLYHKYKKSITNGQEMSKKIADELNIKRILLNASKRWDGGFVIAGLLGHGDSFVLRDQHGIRPAYYYRDDEIIAVASERAALYTSLNVTSNVEQIEPGTALIVKANGDFSMERIFPKKKRISCSFERIYFSRGSDKNIYAERKNLGRALVPKLIKEVGKNFNNLVFSYIPNTAEISFLGMIQEFEQKLKHFKKEEILKLQKQGNLTEANLQRLLSHNIRSEKLAVKDAKLRTFISSGAGRNDLVSHVYDITYGIVSSKDTLIIVDDSIVRGTTLKSSILQILDRLKAKKIIVASSAPQIRYPDCYGIDMANLDDLVAFQAAISLLAKKLQSPEKCNAFLNEIYDDCKRQLLSRCPYNAVKRLYEQFTEKEIAKEITTLVKPLRMKSEISIIFQDIEQLNKVCKNHIGDWYFTGNYPTVGGIKVVNRAFVNYREKKSGVRAY